MTKTEDVLANTAGIDTVHRVVVSLSGGLDSTILTHLLVHKYGADNVHAVSFDYSQRHDIELILAQQTAKNLGIKHTVLDITFMGDIAKNVSAMVKGDVQTPTMEDVLADPQPVTYMPNRNMILASIVAGYAEANDIDGIALGLQAIDSYSYWDTSVEFYQAVQNVLALNRKHGITFITPFINLTKADEIELGNELGVHFGKTWSCYDPQVVETVTIYEPEPAGGRNVAYIDRYAPCGVCPACMERKQAFATVGIEDPGLDGIWVHRRERKLYNFETKACVA